MKSPICNNWKQSVGKYNTFYSNFTKFLFWNLYFFIFLMDIGDAVLSAKFKDSLFLAQLMLKFDIMSIVKFK